MELRVRGWGRVCDDGLAIESRGDDRQGCSRSVANERRRDAYEDEC